MKTPQQYADELIGKYYLEDLIDSNLAVYCAIIDVQNTIEAINPYPDSNYASENIEYYKQVLQILKDKL